MIAISKEEAIAIRKMYPNVHIVRTMKQRSSRHRYYMEEARGAMNQIRLMRAGKKTK